MSADSATFATLELLRRMRPSGERSFEDLCARLLSRISESPLRMCKAGLQGGIDASAIAFAVQAKRYADNLSTPDVEADLAAAARTYKDMELWVLATTATVSSQTADALRTTGECLGVATLVLDAASALPELGDVPSIIALLAADIAASMDFLTNMARWEDDSPKELAAVEAQLMDVAAKPGFTSWLKRLRRSLRELPTWNTLVRSVNEDLVRVIRYDAGNILGTRYDAAAALERDAERELAQWWVTSGSHLRWLKCHQSQFSQANAQMGRRGSSFTGWNGHFRRCRYPSFSSDRDVPFQHGVRSRP